MRFISAKSSYKSKCSAKVPPGVPLNRHRRTQCRSRAYCIDTEPSEGWCLSGVVIRTAPCRTRISANAPDHKILKDNSTKEMPILIIVSRVVKATHTTRNCRRGEPIIVKCIGHEVKLWLLLFMCWPRRPHEPHISRVCVIWVCQ